MIDYTSVQTKINQVYKDALVKVIGSQNGPIDREVLNNLLLGGTLASEVERDTVEPYVPALAQLVLTDVLVQYEGKSSDGDDAIVFDLYTRATPEQIVESNEMRGRQEHQDAEEWNDPSILRDNLTDAVREAAMRRKSIIAQHLILLAMGNAGGSGEEEGDFDIRSILGDLGIAKPQVH